MLYYLLYAICTLRNPRCDQCLQRQPCSQLRAPGRLERARHLLESLMMHPRAAFRGNKAALPSKPCMACGRAMSWRRSWAKNWVAVKFCSDASRRGKVHHG